MPTASTVPKGWTVEGGDLTGSYNDHDVRHSLSGGLDYTFKAARTRV